MAPSVQPIPSAAAVIVAAGGSTRMGSTPVRKPLLELDGRPILEHACAAFQAVERVVEIIVVAHPEDVETIERWCAERESFDKVRGVVAGGSQRADSVRCGVRWCSFAVDVICVHDAARPLVDPALVDETIRRADRDGAALLAVPVLDTLKGSPNGARIDRTIERGSMWSAQTPQAFAARPFREILSRARDERFSPTDDSALWERYRGPVTIVEGEPSNLKITTPADLRLARGVLLARKQDARRLDEGRVR